METINEPNHDNNDRSVTFLSPEIVRERDADGEAVPEVGLAPDVAGEVAEAVGVRVERVQQPELDQRRRRRRPEEVAQRGDSGVDRRAAL